MSAPSALVSKFDFGAAGPSRGTIRRLMWSLNFTAAGIEIGHCVSKSVSQNCLQVVRATYCKN